jgi:hypothetical protein
VLFLLVAGVGLFFAYQYLTGGDDPDETDLDIAGAFGVSATATSETDDADNTVAQVDPTATPEPEPTSTSEPAAVVTPEPEPTATDVPPSPTMQPTRTPEPSPTATNVPNTPTPTVEPTRTPPVPPGVEFAHITNIEWHVDHQHYHIEFEMYELDIEHPDGLDDPNTALLPRPHVHFFVNTVSPEQAGVPGGGPWKLYAGPSTFDSFTTDDIPDNATEICVLIANPDHTVRPDTGNCFPIPPPE